jgi:hypothetical protein
MHRCGPMSRLHAVEGGARWRGPPAESEGTRCGGGGGRHGWPRRDGGGLGRQRRGTGSGAPQPTFPSEVEIGRR